MLILEVPGIRNVGIAILALSFKIEEKILKTLEQALKS